VNLEASISLALDRRQAGLAQIGRADFKYDVSAFAGPGTRSSDRRAGSSSTRQPVSRRPSSRSRAATPSSAYDSPSFGIFLNAVQDVWNLSEQFPEQLRHREDWRRWSCSLNRSTAELRTWYARCLLLSCSRPRALKLSCSGCATSSQLRNTLSSRSTIGFTAASPTLALSRAAAITF
jgi:hypothetical protein